MMLQPVKTVHIMTGAEENRHYLRVFIHTYRDLPVLWDTSLRDYTNRDKRAEAYDQLVPIYRYLKRDATVEDVKKKINTLRTNYRKELKVVESARRAGSMHQPRCWTFHELDFLRNTEKFLAVNPNARGEHFVFNENSQTQASFIDTSSAYNFKAILTQANTLHSPPPNISEMFHKSFGHSTPKFEAHQSPITLPPPPSTQSHSSPAQQSQHNSGGNYGTGALTTEQTQDIMNASTIVKRQRLSPSNTTQQQQQQHQQQHLTSTSLNGHNSEDLLSIARDYISASYPEEETISRTWAIKLKRLQKEQRLLAEKFINDVLFEAESGTLHRGSVQINAFEPYVRYEEQSNEDSTDHHHTKSQSPVVPNSTPTSATIEASEHASIPVTGSTTNTTPTPTSTAQVGSNENNYSNFS